MIRQASDDVQVMNDRGATQIEEVLAESPIVSAVALPVSDVGESVFDVYPFAQLGPSEGSLLALAQLRQEPFIGMDVTLRPWRLGVQRSRSGQEAQSSSGKRTVWPAWNGMTTSGGQVIV